MPTAAKPRLGGHVAALACAYGWQVRRVQRTAEFEPAFASALACGAPDT